MASEQASNEAPLPTVTEKSQTSSSDKPENEKPDIHEAIANIQVTMGTMTKLFERIIEDKADKPLQGDRPTGSRKRKSAEHEDGSDDESDSEASSFRSRGKRLRRDKSPDAISIHAGESEDVVAHLLGCS